MSQDVGIKLFSVFNKDPAQIRARERDLSPFAAHSLLILQGSFTQIPDLFRDAFLFPPCESLDFPHENAPPGGDR